MKNFLKSVFAATLGATIAGTLFFLIGLMLVGAIAGAIAASESKGKPIKENSVLNISLNNPIVDRTSNDPFSMLGNLSGGESSVGLNDILRSLENAKTDDKIKGILLSNMSAANTGAATIEELRNALLDFRLTGKFVISYSEYYGQMPYYLATVADKVYMNPEGLLDLHGLGAGIMFFKGTLEKLGVEAQVIRHGKFKSAVEPFMYDKMSDENRAQIKTYTGSIWAHMLDGIAQQRGTTPAKLNAIANNLQLRDAEAAVSLGLVDALKQRDELLSELAMLTLMDESKKPNLVTVENYRKSLTPKNITVKNKVAIVYADGEIVDEGKDGIVGKRLAAELRDVRRDSSIKAVVLRVNSPGGSALASELICREVKLLTQIKPVVVSMGDVAASGGYYVACPANCVMASPSTITGSIGVFGVLFNAKKFFKEKLGVTVDVAATNDHADMGSIHRALTKPEVDFIQHHIEKIYSTFVGHVAEGRSMTRSEVDNIGQGRVWSGVDAKRIKLVDEYGGLNAAVEKAVLLANLEKYRVIELPKQKETIEIIMENLGQAKVRLTKKSTGNILEDYEPLAKILRMNGKAQARLPYDVEMK